jgi:hypothetical protein
MKKKVEVKATSRITKYETKPTKEVDKSWQQQHTQA